MKYKHQNEGFTLIEVIVSITILSIIAIAFLPVFTTSSGMVFHAGNKSVALNRAQMEMENLIADKTVRTSPPIQNTANMTITDTVTEAAVNIASAAGTPALPAPTIQGRQLQSEVVYNSANRKAILNSFIPD